MVDQVGDGVQRCLASAVGYIQPTRRLRPRIDLPVISDPRFQHIAVVQIQHFLEDRCRADPGFRVAVQVHGVVEVRQRPLAEQRPAVPDVLPLGQHAPDPDRSPVPLHPDRGPHAPHGPVSRVPRRERDVEAAGAARRQLQHRREGLMLPLGRGVVVDDAVIRKDPVHYSLPSRHPTDSVAVPPVGSVSADTTAG